MIEKVSTFSAIFVVLALASTHLFADKPTRTMNVSVVCEEIITSYERANNGAQPLWCYGAPLIVRQGDCVSVSIIETGKDVPLLCNTRWQVWQRNDQHWRLVVEESDYRQREPCPLVGLPSGELFLSANPSTQPPGTQYGECKPEVIRLAKQRGETSQTSEFPAWTPGTNFTDHSYRGLGADGEGSELLLLHINATTSAQFVSHRDCDGDWHPRGEIKFPIRAAYPQVALRSGAAHVLAIGDIQEPVSEWRDLKLAHLNRKWDYVFRRLFYTWTPNVEAVPFVEPLEVDSVESTAGFIRNLDLHVDEHNRAHLLYLKRPYHYDFLRDEFFPGEPISQRLKYAIIEDGRVVTRRTLEKTPDNGEGFEPSYARFHVGPSEKLSVVAAGMQLDSRAQSKLVNVLIDVNEPASRFVLPLAHPFRVFFTNTPRGGSQPSNDLDLFGTCEDIPRLRYAHLQLRQD